MHRIIYIITLVLLAGTNVSGQSKKNASLVLELPAGFTYDSIWLDIKDQTVFKSYLLPNQKKKKVKFKNVLPAVEYARTSVRIYFKGNNYNFKDTLDFLAGNKDASIKILDTITAKESSAFKLSNIYNFEILFKKFQDVTQPAQINANQYTESIMGFIKDNLDDPFSLDLFAEFVLRNTLFDYSISKDFFDVYIDKLIHVPQFRKYIETLLEAKTYYSMENIKAPLFFTTTLDNKNLSSEGLKGQYVLINFWATFCVPCREEFPALKKIIEAYNGNGLTTISVSLDNDIEAVKQFVAQNNMNWNQVVSDTKIISVFGINPIPQIYLIDPDGIIVYNKFLKENHDTDLSILSFYLSEHLKKLNQ